MCSKLLHRPGLLNLLLEPPPGVCPEVAPLVLIAGPALAITPYPGAGSCVCCVTVATSFPVSLTTFA